LPADALSPEAGRLRLLLGAFGDPGHAFPMIALGRALAARGHDVVLQTWRRWEEHVVAEGMRFAPAPEYHVFPTRERPLKPYEAAVRAAEETRPVIRSFAPDVAVSDILTPAPALAAELEGVPVATLVPHVYPDLAPGFPPYAIGARLPRTVVGRLGWRLRLDLRKPTLVLSDIVGRTFALIFLSIRGSHRRHGRLACSVALSGQAPKPHSGAPKARGLTANAQSEQA